MTTWDDIYKNYQNGGEAWATLSEDIDPRFKLFLNHSNFTVKHALDIGCGTGKYLKFLQIGGFKTDGIDSSETAVEMTKEVLGVGATVLCTNMFAFEIPKNKYDLVISISTIHHGNKEQVQGLINKIYEAISREGKIFITVPDLESALKRNAFEDQEQVSEGTFAPLAGHEKGLPHSFYTKDEVLELFSKYKDIKLEIDEIGRWFVQASK